MIRTFNADSFNKIANDPDIKPWLAFEGEGYLDLSPLVNNFNNVCLLTDCENGGYILENKGDGLYIAHTLSKKEARGEPMMTLTQEGFQYLFLETDCLEVSTYVPDNSKAAKRWTELSGFRPTFHRPEFLTVNGERVGATFHTMTYFDWVNGNPTLQVLGEFFHEFIESSIGHPNHPDDPIHDQWVGATYLGIQKKNVLKAVYQYNRWSAVSGYSPVEILNLEPPVINIGNVILEMFDGKMRVLKNLEG